MKPSRIVELIHRAIPYPVILIARHGESSSVSFAHKRWSQGQGGKVVIEDIRRVDIMHPESPDTRELAFLKSLSLSNLPMSQMYSMYQGMVDRAVAFEAAQITGSFVVPESDEQSADIRKALENHAKLKSELIVLRSKAAKEKQLNRRVELNLEIKRLEKALSANSDGLANKDSE